VLGEVDSSGVLQKARVYDVYGGVRRDDGRQSASKHKFVGALGHQSEGETGLVTMRARYMDPETGLRSIPRIAEPNAALFPCSVTQGPRAVRPTREIAPGTLPRLPAYPW